MIIENIFKIEDNSLLIFQQICKKEKVSRIAVAHLFAIMTGQSRV